mmetsp:Transcript_2667/g.3563  ORF Transcript_2667/g.3563 Transcript_2667/m.3563 type:complete len:162 (-) Transcript_2667:52-537(-)
MTSPIPTRSRATLLEVDAYLYVDSTNQPGAATCLLLRRPRFLAAHISTGSRVLIPSSSGLYESIDLDFWERQSTTNGRHYSTRVVVPASWPSNLFLSAVVQSVSEKGILSIHTTILDDGCLQLPPQFTVEEVHHMFMNNIKQVETQLIATADLHRAHGGDV